MTIRIWDIEDGECLNILHGHKDYIYSVFVTDNNYIISGS